MALLQLLALLQLCCSKSESSYYLFQCICHIRPEKKKLKKPFSSADLQDIKAPVTALCQLEGYLLVAQGPNPGMIGPSTLYVYALWHLSSVSNLCGI